MCGVAYGPPVEYGYQPLLYNSYVVYYTDIGEPYYWLGGARVWVPTYARGPYLGHWQRYRHVYPTWYKHRGAYYQTRQFHGRGNPPGHAGGPGTNWKNPPGPLGGPGASPRRPYGAPHYRDGNPAGPVGGPGTNWENRPGPAGGLGASPDHRPAPGRYRDRDGNPPGQAGGPGTNWDNRPGPSGGPGTAPDRQPGPGRYRDRDGQAPGPAGAPGGAFPNRRHGRMGSTDDGSNLGGGAAPPAGDSTVILEEWAKGQDRPSGSGAQAEAEARQQQAEAQARQQQQAQAEAQAREKAQADAQARPQPWPGWKRTDQGSLRPEATSTSVLPGQATRTLTVHVRPKCPVHFQSTTCPPPCSASQPLRCSNSGSARPTRNQNSGVWFGSTRCASSWTMT